MDTITSHKYAFNTENAANDQPLTLSGKDYSLPYEGRGKSLQNVKVLTEVSPTHVPPRSARMRARSRAASAEATANTPAPPLPRLTPHQITAFASGVLEMTHAFNEFHSMHKDPELVRGFLINKHIDDPRYGKMQRVFNSLQNRVSIHGSSNIRIQNLFSILIQKVISNPDSVVIPSEMEKTIDEIIGIKNIVSSGPFKKFGVICVKDAALPNPRPENVVSTSELKEMQMLREKLRILPLFNKVKIEGSLEFTKKTLESFEKMLCYPEGREIVRGLYSVKKPTIISLGKQLANGRDPSKYKVTVDHKNSSVITTANGKSYSLVTPSWLGLAHELIHILHEDGGLKESRAVKHALDDRWGNAEEYVTIGDPDNPPALSENGFLDHTMYPRRNFHFGGVEKDSNPFTYIANIDREILDGDFERLLIDEPDMPLGFLKIIVKARTIEKFAHLKMQILDHPRKEEFIKQKLLFRYLLSSIAHGHNQVIVRILNDYPALLKELDDGQKRDLFFEAAINNSPITPILMSKGIHRTYTPKIYFAYLNHAIDKKNIKLIKSLVTLNAYLKFDRPKFLKSSEKSLVQNDPKVIKAMGIYL